MQHERSSTSSSSNDVLISLPNHVRCLFPFLIFTHSGCTKTLLDYINSNVVRAVNFAKIRESIAEFNFQHFCRCGIIFNSALQGGWATGDSFIGSEFYKDRLYSFPSGDHIMSILLSHFDAKKRSLPK